MTKENRVLKLRLEVDEETASLLDGQSRICNWLYNHLIDKGQQLKQQFIQSQDRESAKTLYTLRGLRNLLPSIKAEHPFLKGSFLAPKKHSTEAQ